MPPTGLPWASWGVPTVARPESREMSRTSSIQTPNGRRGPKRACGQPTSCISSGWLVAPRDEVRAMDGLTRNAGEPTVAEAFAWLRIGGAAVVALAVVL